MSNLRVLLIVTVICLPGVNFSVQGYPDGTFRYQMSGIKFLQLNNASDCPCFQFYANIISPDNKPVELITHIDLDEELMEKTTILYQNSPINKSNILVEAGNNIAKRYTIILIDQSGTMLERIGHNGTKFDASMSAAVRFAENFTDNIDNMAIIPFSSRDVHKRIMNTRFMTNKADFRTQVNGITHPLKDNNTGLYSAVLYAIQRLCHIRSSSEDLIKPELLLIVLTDGQNDVHSGDDPDLLKDPYNVMSMLDTAGVDVTTIGFGSNKDLNEIVLKRLAKPDQTRYYNANDTSQLNDAFIITRKYQLEKLRITFIPSEKSNTQILDGREIKVMSEFNGAVIKGELEWQPGMSLGFSKFEGTLDPLAYKKLIARINKVETEKIYSFYLKLSLFSIVFITILFFLWKRLPNKFWKKETDKEILTNRIIPIRDRILKQSNFS